MRSARSCGRGSKPSCREFPDIKVEIYIENRLTDIVAERYDAGVRLGEHVAKDMIAVRIGPDWRLVVVGSPSYFAGRAMPKTPHDLTGHRCINLGSRPMADFMPGSSRRRPAAQCPRRRATRLQHHLADPQGGACRTRSGLRAGGHGQAAYRPGRVGPCAGRLVPAFPGLSSLLPEPPPGLARIRRRGRCAAVSRLADATFAGSVGTVKRRVPLRGQSG